MACRWRALALNLSPNLALALSLDPNPNQCGARALPLHLPTPSIRNTPPPHSQAQTIMDSDIQPLKGLVNIVGSVREAYCPTLPGCMTSQEDKVSTLTPTNRC